MNGHPGDHSYFWLTRLYSLTGVVFAAAFVLLFLIPYSSIFGGAAAFNGFMVRMNSIPMLGWALALFVLAPLVFHMMMGVLIIYNCQINVVSYGYYRNWMYALQRLAGLFLIPFVAYHIYTAWLVPALSDRALTAGKMYAMLASPWMKAFYCAGLACAAFYIGSGLASAARSWGLAASRRSRGAFVIAGWIVTIVLAAWGMKIVFSF